MQNSQTAKIGLLKQYPTGHLEAEIMLGVSFSSSANYYHRRALQFYCSIIQIASKRSVKACTVCALDPEGQNLRHG